MRSAIGLRKKARIANLFPLEPGNPPVVLQIGETRVVTRRDTLTKGAAADTHFAALLSGRHQLPTTPDGGLFLDRDGAAIPTLMNYLRSPQEFRFQGNQRLAEQALVDADYYLMPED